MTVDQHPVGAGVDEVGGHEREHHRRDDVDALQIAAERRVEQQQRRAPQNHAEVARADAAARPGESRATGIATVDARADEHQAAASAAAPARRRATASDGTRRSGARRTPARPACRARAAGPCRRSQTPCAARCRCPPRRSPTGPSGPTMIVSTTPIAIQPSSARTTGTAMRSMGRSSARMREGDHGTSRRIACRQSSVVSYQFKGRRAAKWH